MDKCIQKTITTERKMLSLGEKLASLCQAGDVFYLKGNLGVGKTTLVRGFLKTLGYTGFIKSPTYTLIEVYKLKDFAVVHVDLYRLSDSHDYWQLGLSDYLTPDSVLIVEWPERADIFLPSPTIHIQIDIGSANERIVNLSLTNRSFKLNE